MPWHKVVISKNDVTTETCESRCECLMNSFGPCYRKYLENGESTEVEVFHEETEDAHIYYFSPCASEIALVQENHLFNALALSEFTFEALSEPPNLSTARLIRL
jgi:hypothetical protein